MNPINLLILSLVYVITSFIITLLVLKISIKNNLFDIPNSRSSHTIPKPKGGGIGIIIPLATTVLILFSNEMISVEITKSIVIGLIFITTIGLIDDYHNLSASIRIIAYLVGSGFSLHLIGGLEFVSINENTFYLGNIGYFFGVIFLVWLTNLYNFMDGTDGFAAIQTICVSLFCFFLFFLSENLPFYIIMLCMASTTIGFLYWNWAPAKIFMGDAGSCTIGFLFGLFCIYTENEEIISITVWAILLAPFIGDATFTLLKRIANSARWYEAHNSHAYQKLYQHGFSHNQLALGLFAANIFLIWPLGYFAYTYEKYELLMLVLTYILTVITWFIIQYKYRKIT
tara:strand:+ start:267 stop:1292 length:1026 start_codon:yes stop_codon:yes gene_type:complete